MYSLLIIFGNRPVKSLLGLFFLIIPLGAFAIETPPEEELENAEQETLDVGEEPLELDEYTVTGIRFTMEQETALRMVRQALKANKSYKREDKDKWVCLVPEACRDTSYASGMCPQR